MRVMRTIFRGFLVALAVTGLASIGRWVYLHRELATRYGPIRPEPAPVP